MYDVIVVGAGTGGTIAARRAAELGLHTCLLDRKAGTHIGEKVCGDAIERVEFDLLKIPYPSGEMLAQEFKGLNFYAPDSSVYVPVKYAGFIVHRHRFGQHLLQAALDRGVEFYTEYNVKAPLRDHDQIIGVQGHNGQHGEAKEIRGKVVIDASGCQSILRRSVRSSYGESTLPKTDLMLCYREILRTNQMPLDPDRMHLFLSHSHTPGGYWWLFPEGGGQVNIGMGVCTAEGFNVKDCYYRTIQSYIAPPFQVIHTGGGVVPVRRMLTSLVENGILFIGDAACQANPLHGGGIGPSMCGGTYAAEVVKTALDRNDCSIDGLWEYNQRYAHDQGAGFAALDLFRRLFYQLTDAEINFVFRYRLLTGKDLLTLITGKALSPELIEIGRQALQTSAPPHLIEDLLTIVKLMNAVRDLYHALPDRGQFDPWHSQVCALFQTAEHQFKERHTVT